MGLKGIYAAAMTGLLALQGASEEPFDTHVKNLSKDSWKTREVATKNIQKDFTEETYQKLQKIFPSLDLESQRRIEPMLTAFNEKKIVARVAKIKQDFKGSLPWIDMIDPKLPDFPYVIQAYLKNEPTEPKWQNYRDAMENLLIDKLRRQESVDTFLAQAKANEIKFVNNFGKRMRPPVLSKWD